jgi:CheY-like chemotaxis protein
MRAGAVQKKSAETEGRGMIVPGGLHLAEVCERRCLAVGMSAHLAKPFSAQTLQAMMNRVVKPVVKA